MKFGLIGKTIKHSVSPSIHKYLGGYDYGLWELEEGELKYFFERRDFIGLNVTIPYKKKVVEYLDELVGVANDIKVVNTIVNKDGKLYGYNTDYFGFDEMLKYNDVSVCGANVAILGNGGVSKTVEHYMQNSKAKSIEIFTHKDIDNGVKSDADIVVNCTPVGKYPDTKNSPVNFDNLRNVKVAIDLIYNPYNTAFLLDAKAHNARAINGLYMLIAQAKVASELFTGNIIDNAQIDSLYDEMKRERLNIVLIGMGGCGKSSIGKKIAKSLNTSFYDTDELIEKEVGCTTKDYILKYGEDDFRRIENDVVLSLEDKRGVVIATGGGTVISPQNMYSLKRNGCIVFLDTPIDKLNFENRPLYKTLDEVKFVYNDRLPKYKSADIIIKNDHTKSLEEVGKEIIDETFSY